MTLNGAYVRIAAFIFLTSALSMALYVLEYPDGVSRIVGSVAASAAAALAIVYSTAKIREHREHSTFEEGLSDSLSSAIFYNSS